MLKKCFFITVLLLAATNTYSSNVNFDHVKKYLKKSQLTTGTVNGIKYSLPVGLLGGAVILLLTPTIPGLDKQINPELFVLTTALAGGFVGSLSTLGVENKKLSILRGSTAGLMTGFIAFCAVCVTACLTKI